MASHTRPAAFSLLLGTLLLVGSGCSRSQNEGRTVLETHYDDSRVGSEAAEALAAQLGLLGDPELDAYVSGIGHRLLRRLQRRLFDYSFEVVNVAEPNAFVLPGGYVFLSRGLLALTNNEDELACVLGHEIVHAEHRHAARQQVLEQQTSSPLLRSWRRAARRAAYSREMELEADKGGQHLCAAAGYDPMGMSTLLASLQQAERLRLGFTREPSFFDTHPGSRERAAINAARAGKISWLRDPSLGDTRAALLRRIDGIDVGQRPQSGVFAGDRFLHPVLDFQISFPVGWQTSSTNQVVGAQSPELGTTVFLTANQPAGDPRTRAEEWLEELDDENVRVDASRGLQIGSLPAWRLDLSTSGIRRPATGHATFFSYGDLTYRVIGVAPNRAARQQLRRTLTTTRSFRPLSPENRRTIQAHRLRVVTALPSESLQALGRRTGSAWTISRLALQNALFSNHVFEGGESVKISRAEPYERPGSHGE
jgi:predicted Zn-dependent protease